MRDARSASPSDPVPYMRLVIKGRDAPVALDDADGVADLLDDLGAPPAATLHARINALRNSPTDALAGLGGIQARAALDAADVTLAPGTGNYGGPLATFDVVGQIQDEVDLGGGASEAGFYYKSDEPMHVWVEMITTATRFLPNGQQKSKTWAEMYRVEVPANAITVEAKDLADSGNVFPGFAAEAFGVSAGMAGPFLYKLWEVGTTIQVTDYWIDRNVQPGNEPSYPPGQRYTASNHPQNLANIFQPDAEACIDMMFQRNPDLDVADGGALDDGRLPDGAYPPYYCLGRCADPPILNTR